LTLIDPAKFSDRTEFPAERAALTEPKSLILLDFQIGPPLATVLHEAIDGCGVKATPLKHPVRRHGRSDHNDIRVPLFTSN